MSLPKNFSPMLACDLGNIETYNRFPVYAQPKLDGIRCIVQDGICYSRTLKSIPNKFINDKIKSSCIWPPWFIYDGEILTYTNGEQDSFNTIQSKVMSVEGEPEFKYVMFDMIDNLSHTYAERMFPLPRAEQRTAWQYLDVCEPKLINNKEELANYVACFKDTEGVILRSSTGLYKFGRSTLKQGYLLKYKFIKESEATVIGFEPLVTIEGQELDMLGALIVKDGGMQFKIGTGFTETQRKAIWLGRHQHSTKESYYGARVKYEYQEFGMKDNPRCPVFICRRLDE